MVGPFPAPSPPRPSLMRCHSNGRITAGLAAVTLKHWSQLRENAVTRVARSCVEIHTMTPAASCNKTIASVDRLMTHDNVCTIAGFTWLASAQKHVRVEHQQTLLRLFF